MPDITGITYLSDGRTRTCTIWLSSPFKEPPNNATVKTVYPSTLNIPWYMVRYGMTINTPSIYDTGDSDYQNRIIWDLNTRNWTYALYELSPSGKERPLMIIPNYTNFFQVGKDYVDLSIILKDINFPSQYTIFFYVSDVFINDGYLCRLLDISNRVYIPPPEFKIKTLPSAVILKPGDEKNVEVNIKSDTRFESQILLTTIQPKGLILTFTPNKTSISPLSAISSQLHIKALENLSVHPYTIPILAKLSFPTEIKILNSNGDKMSNFISANISESSDLTITVLNPLSISDRLNNFYNSWLSPIGSIWTFLAGVDAVLAPLIIRLYNKKYRHSK